MSLNLTDCIWGIYWTILTAIYVFQTDQRSHDDYNQEMESEYQNS